MRRLLTLTLSVLVGMVLFAPGGWADAPPGTPTATTFAGNPTVGPLFRAGLASDHECTASVIASKHHDLVLTAAHCVFGDVAGWQIAPGYDNGRTPYGVWTVAAAYVPAAWQRSQDTQHDYAILRMAPQTWHGRTVDIQDVTGANRLGTAPHAGKTVTDVAYNAGIDDRPIHCTVPVYDTDGYPSFNCHGYVGGSSGSPWLLHRRVVGVIGGLHQGGCFEYTSYTSRFAADVHRLQHRAERGGRGDVPPVPGSDGC